MTPGSTQATRSSVSTSTTRFIRVVPTITEIAVQECQDLMAARETFKDAAKGQQLKNEYDALSTKLEQLEADFQTETEDIQSSFDPQALALETISLAPKKSEINVSDVILVWRA